MLLFFVRHGETVDNVAGVYAGVKDSELTNHGILQARQLGEYLSLHRPPISAIFSSPLQRARKTAEAILTAQKTSSQGDTNVGQEQRRAAVALVQSPLLIEQDFGYYEGKPFFARSTYSTKSGKATHYDDHKNDPGFQDVESGTSMARRCDQYLDTLLLPAIRQRAREAEETAIVIVSHGILLSQLWRRFLLVLSRKSITIAPEVTASKGQIVLEHPGGWRNTGFLEIRLVDTQKDPDGHGQSSDGTISVKVDLGSEIEPEASPATATATTVRPPRPITPVEKVDQGVGLPVPTSSSPAVDDSAREFRSLVGYKTTILTINGQDHLRGVKRARGGIGSAKYDEGQKKLDTFFKKPSSKP